MELFVTGCISMINNRPLAFCFEGKLRELNRKISTGFPPDRLKEIKCGRIGLLSAMLVFDPDPKPKSRIEIKRYHGKDKCQGMYVHWSIEEYGAIAEAARETSLCAGLITGFQDVLEKSKPAEAAGVGYVVENLRKMYHENYPNIAEKFDGIACLESADSASQLRVEIGAADVPFERLVELEEMLASKLSESAEVDGHDIGMGQFNIFINTSKTAATRRAIRIALDQTDFREKYSIRSSADD